MKTHESISHFTGQEQTHLRQVERIVVGNLQPMAIFCYETALSNAIERNCFTLKRKTEKSEFTCGLLVILPDNVPLRKNATKMVTELAQAGCKVHAIVHPLRFVLKKIDSGNLFFSWVRRSAIKLYDRGDAETWLPEPILKNRNWELQADKFYLNGTSMENYLVEKLQPRS